MLYELYNSNASVKARILLLIDITWVWRGPMRKHTMAMQVMAVSMSRNFLPTETNAC